MATLAVVDLIFTAITAAGLLWLVLKGDRDEKLTLGANLLVAVITAGFVGFTLLNA
jgi:hypothetical protein